MTSKEYLLNSHKDIYCIYPAFIPTLITSFNSNYIVYNVVHSKLYTLKLMTGHRKKNIYISGRNY